MLRTSRQSFALTGLANRVLIPILRSRAGRQLGRRFAVVEYLGRRSGRPYKLVTQYAVVGRTARITVGCPARKTWWRNFIGPHPLRLRLAGEEFTAMAHVEQEGDLITVVAERDTPGRGAPDRSARSASMPVRPRQGAVARLPPPRGSPSPHR